VTPFLASEGGWARLFDRKIVATKNKSLDGLLDLLPDAANQEGILPDTDNELGWSD
jgi:hypothetical protein